MGTPLDVMRTQFGGSQAPDGTVWVTVTHQVGNASFTYGIPLADAETIATAFRDQVLDAAAKLRRQQSGLVVAAAPVDSTAVKFNRAAEAARRAHRGH